MASNYLARYVAAVKADQVVPALNQEFFIALTILKNDRLVNYGIIAAGVVIAVIPAYIVFIFFQEQIVRGLHVGAVKS